jgi:hypothetical protein
MCNNCEDIRKVPEYLSNLKQVANDIGDMPYEKVVEFFEHLQTKIKKDSESISDKKMRLSLLLERAAFNLYVDQDQFKKICEICKEYDKKQIL